MGRYVYGSSGFTYKYMVAAQPTNLNDLAAWDEFSGSGRSLGIGSQFYMPHDEDAPYRFITGVSWAHTAYEMTIDASSLQAATGIELGGDIEYAIYAVTDHWQKAVLAIDQLLPGPAVGPDLARVGSIKLHRESWSALATRLGNGVDVADRSTLEAAREKLFKSGEENYLPLLAINALMHAVEHDLDVMELVDGEPTQTNLWSCVSDVARAPAEDASWEDRYAYALFRSYSHGAGAVDSWKLLADERPQSMPTLRNLFAKHLWDDKWEPIWARANAALENAPDEIRGELFLWRGDAARCLDRNEEAMQDAKEAARLGQPALLNALTKQEE